MLHNLYLDGVKVACTMASYMYVHYVHTVDPILVPYIIGSIIPISNSN